jgi:hypothetical protein
MERSTIHLTDRPVLFVGEFLDEWLASRIGRCHRATDDASVREEGERVPLPAIGQI